MTTRKTTRSANATAKTKTKPPKKRRKYTDEFRRDAVKLVTEQGYSLAEAARNLGVHANLLLTWKLNVEAEDSQVGAGLGEDERLELARLRSDVKRLQMERDILKKATAFFANEKS